MSKPRALAIWGGWEGHEPKECIERFLPFMCEHFEVEVADSLAVLAEARLAEFAVIVPCWTMGTLSDEEWQGLDSVVRSGTGLVGWHGGLCDAFREHTGYQFMTGGQFVAHPGDIFEYDIRITQPDHPCLCGLRNFSVHTEQYYLHVDPGNDVLAETTFSGERCNESWIAGTVMPVVWTRQWGEGRVFYSAIGHVATDFDNPEVYEVQCRGILWGAKLL